jgi:hypothetical protein
VRPPNKILHIKNDPNYIPASYNPYATPIDNKEARRMSLIVSGSTSEKKTDPEISKPFIGHEKLRKLSNGQIFKLRDLEKGKEKGP